ncbi:MAG: hypothetical protein WDZ41_01890 [Candidatus Babeliales bacterium]
MMWSFIVTVILIGVCTVILSNQIHSENAKQIRIDALEKDSIQTHEQLNNCAESNKEYHFE